MELVHVWQKRAIGRFVLVVSIIRFTLEDWKAGVRCIANRSGGKLSGIEATHRRSTLPLVLMGTLSK